MPGGAPSIRANTTMSNDWPTIGLDYAETRFSKLSQITADNVKKLGLAWSYPLESSRGVEATPLVVDGIMYVTASWSVVHAIDARTGKRLWSYDPKVDRTKGYKGCCDVVNRGVALWKGKVFYRDQGVLRNRIDDLSILQPFIDEPDKFNAAMVELVRE